MIRIGRRARVHGELAARSGCVGVLRRRLHLREERLGALLQLHGRQVLKMLGEPPAMAEGILQTPIAFAAPATTMLGVTV
jgi:hypothetical protein